MARKYRFCMGFLDIIKKVKFALALGERFGIIRAVSAIQRHYKMWLERGGGGGIFLYVL